MSLPQFSHFLSEMWSHHIYRLIDFAFEEHVSPATERFRPNQWSGCSFPHQFISFWFPSEPEWPGSLVPSGGSRKYLLKMSFSSFFCLQLISRTKPIVCSLHNVFMRCFRFLTLYQNSILEDYKILSYLLTDSTSTTIILLRICFLSSASIASLFRVSTNCIATEKSIIILKNLILPFSLPKLHFIVVFYRMNGTCGAVL